MRNKVLIFSLIINIIIMGLALPVFAQSNTTEIESIEINSIDDILTIIENITSWMYRILLAIVVIFVLMAAFTYLTSSGNIDKIKKANNQLLYAAIAVVIAILSFSVSQIITSVLSE